MRLGKKESGSSYGTFSLGIGAAFYVPLLIFAVIFTQALRSPVSVVFLWFVVTLPVISFFYALIGRANVGAFVLSDETTAEKLAPVGYEFRVSNYSILPLPFTEAEIYLPTADGVTCERRLIKMSVLPRGEYHFKSTVTFRYRGSYRVGVGCIYVSDVMRIFRLRRYVDIYSKIYVMPRKLLYLREDDRSPADTPADGHTVDGIESSETNLIREYRRGDPLKHIHWKLSSKMQDLQVNDYKPNPGRNIYVFCDFATFFDEPPTGRREKRREKKAVGGRKKRVVNVRLPERSNDDRLTTDEKLDAMAAAAKDKAAAAAATAAGRLAVIERDRPENAEKEYAAKDSAAKETDFSLANDVRPDQLIDFDEFCADGVSEIAVGVILYELGRGNTVTLMWFDERADNGFFCYPVGTYSDIDAFFKHFGTAPFCPHDMRVTMLPMLVDDSDSPTFIYVTASAGLSDLGDYVSASRGAGAERSEVLLFDPEDKFTDTPLHREYVDICSQRYAENKIRLTTVKPGWDKRF